MVDLYAIDEFDDEDEVEPRHPLLQQLEMGNLVDQLDDTEDGAKAAERIMGLYENAKKSMGPWLKKYKEAIWLAKLQPYSEGAEIEKKTFPFDGASMDMLPNVMEAMLDFSSRASPELVWARDLIKVKVYGDDQVEEQPPQQPGQPPQQVPNQNKRTVKEQRAERVGIYSNYQLREEMPYWRDEQDKLLLCLPCVGTAFKEAYFDADEGKICSDLIYGNELIFDHGYSRFDLAPDKFIELKLSRNDVLSYIRGEQAWDLDEDKFSKELDEFKFIKAYSWIDMDDDGIREPYIAIIHEESNKIVYIQPNYDDDTLTLNDEGEVIKIKPNKRFTQYRFLPDPEGGPMGLGWGILLGESFASLNTMLRQMIDAGTLQNSASNSGIVELDTSTGRGNALSEGVVEVILGQLTPVNTRGNRPLRDSVYQFPAQGPSQALFQLMDHLSEALRRMTTASSQIEANTNEAATLYLARLQQALKVPNAIIMRVYQAAEQEFKTIFSLNYKYNSDEVYNRVLDNDIPANMKNDFNPADCDIRLIADPSQGSDIERAARAEAILQEAKANPGGPINLRQAYMDWLESLRTPNIEQLTPIPAPDPMVEMMRLQQQMEAEFQNRELELKERELGVREQKNALQAAKDMAELGLADDEMIAKITKTYAESLSLLVNIGMSPRDGLKLMRGEDAYLSDQPVITQQGGDVNGAR